MISICSGGSAPRPLFGWASSPSQRPTRTVARSISAAPESKMPAMIETVITRNERTYGPNPKLRRKQSSFDTSGVGELATLTPSARRRVTRSGLGSGSHQKHERPVRSSLTGALPYPHLSKISPELPMQPIRGRAKEKCETDADIGHCPKGGDTPSNDGRQWLSRYCRLNGYRRAKVSHSVRVREHVEDVVIIGRIVDARDPGWISRTRVSERDDGNENS